MEGLINSLIPYLNYHKTGLLTSIWVAFLHSLFIVFLGYLIIKISRIVISIQNLNKDFSEDRISANHFLKDFWESYTQHFIVINDRSRKTEDFAENFFNQNIIQKSMNIGLWKGMPGMFVGLGILGTFVGLSIGISGFNFSSSKNILDSIQTLIDGIETAFLTSLHGIALSIIFGYTKKLAFNKLEVVIYQLCSVLNAKFKFTKEEKIQETRKEREEFFQKWETIYNKGNLEVKETIISEFKNCLEQLKKNSEELFQKNGKLLNQYRQEIQNSISGLNENLNALFITKDEKGNEIRPGNILRDL